MASPYANINPAPMTDGIVYAAKTPLTSNEADLFSGPTTNGDPAQVTYGEAVLAIVQFTAQGEVSNTAYVVMQTDLGDGVWVDVAGVVWTGTSGGATFVLSGGVAGANAFQQTRAAGTAPAANFSNQIPLGGRIRFVGKAATSAQNQSSSSASSGSLISQVTATIRFKILGLR